MDNLANSFSKIQNSQTRRKKFVFLKFSKIIWNICTVLCVEGFIQGFERRDENILIYLKYSNDKPVLQKILKISLQGRRVYTKKIPTSKISKNKFVMGEGGGAWGSAGLRPLRLPSAHFVSPGFRPATPCETPDFVPQDLKRLEFPSPNFPQKGILSHSSHRPLVTKGLGLKILSTSRGILCDRDARFFGVGGEILCEIF